MAKEILVVDDDSPDGTANEVQNISKAKKNVQGILVQQMGKGYEVIIGKTFDERDAPLDEESSRYFSRL